MITSQSYVLAVLLNPRLIMCYYITHQSLHTTEPTEPTFHGYNQILTYVDLKFLHTL